MDEFKLSLGNLNYDATEDDIAKLFADFGEVLEVVLPVDRYTRRPRGFAFVLLKTKEAGEKAIEKLNGQDFLGRKLVVNWARPKVDRQ